MTADVRERRGCPAASAASTALVHPGLSLRLRRLHRPDPGLAVYPSNSDNKKAAQSHRALSAANLSCRASVARAITQEMNQHASYEC